MVAKTVVLWYFHKSTKKEKAHLYIVLHTKKGENTCRNKRLWASQVLL